MASDTTLSIERNYAIEMGRDVLNIIFKLAIFNTEDRMVRWRIWSNLRIVSKQFKEIVQPIMAVVHYWDSKYCIEHGYNHSFRMLINMMMRQWHPNLKKHMSYVSLQPIIRFCFDSIKNIEALCILLEEVASPIVLSDENLSTLCQIKTLDGLRMLLGRESFLSYNNANFMLRCATNWGNEEGVRMLLQYPNRVNPLARNQKALRLAAQIGHEGIFRLLLSVPGADPSVANNEALMKSAQNGHVEIVKILLNHPKVDPNARKNGVAKIAAGSGKLDVLKVLLKDERFEGKLWNEILYFFVAIRREEWISFLLEDERVDPSSITFKFAVQSVRDWDWSYSLTVRQTYRRKTKYLHRGYWAWRSWVMRSMNK